jgi:hypothetical protein
MKKRMRAVLRKSLCAFCSLALLGCGGGGGSNGNRGAFTVSPSTLTFTATSTGGTTIGPQQIRGTISGASPQTLFLNVLVTGNAVASVGDIVITSETSGTANVYPVPQHVAGAGNYSSVITITACTTSVACTSGTPGWLLRGSVARDPAYG